MTGSPPSPLDVAAWPIVHFAMPETVPDELAELRVAEFDALLARDERFVLITTGPMMPADSKAFMRLYGAWSKRTRDTMGRLCAGSVRVEPDAGKRKSFAALAMTFLQRTAVPYPIEVVATVAEAEAQARRWLAAESPKSI